MEEGRSVSVSHAISWTRVPNWSEREERENQLWVHPEVSKWPPAATTGDRSHCCFFSLRWWTVRVQSQYKINPSFPFFLWSNHREVTLPWRTHPGPPALAITTSVDLPQTSGSFCTPTAVCLNPVRSPAGTPQSMSHNASVIIPIIPLLLCDTFSHSLKKAK